MNILVIGNGFDIAHDLPTSYPEFLDFVTSLKTRFDGFGDKKSFMYSEIASFSVSEPSLYKELKDLISDNRLLDYYLSILEDRRRDGRTGWIDFETELSYIVQTFDVFVQKYEEVLSDKRVPSDRSIRVDPLCYELLRKLIFKSHEEYAFTPKQFKENLPIWKKSLLEDVRKITRCLEIYLSCFINYDSLSPLPVIKGITPDYIISFNYTKTYEMVYPAPSKIDYIHGMADKNANVNSNRMVLGIGEYLTDERRDKDNEFAVFKKFFQRIIKRTGSTYKDWLKEFEGGKTLSGFSEKGGVYHELNVHIYGHSLDPTDGDILYDLITDDNANVTIYYKDDDSLSKQISNLIQVIGEAKLIELTDYSTGRLKFVKCGAT